MIQILNTVKQWCTDLFRFYARAISDNVGAGCYLLSVSIYHWIPSKLDLISNAIHWFRRQIVFFIIFCIFLVVVISHRFFLSESDIQSCQDMITFAFHSTALQWGKANMSHCSPSIVGWYGILTSHLSKSFDWTTTILCAGLEKTGVCLALLFTRRFPCRMAAITNEITWKWNHEN